ncbi:MAG: hypothetical protein WCF85_07635 [Rhodospirillaceae bacterium]
MDDELRAVLGSMASKLDEVLTTQREHGRRLDRIEQRLDGVEQRLDRMEPRLDRMEPTLDRVAGEQQQVKEMLAGVRLREIGRLDGRIDQLAQDVGFARRAS